MHKKPHKEEKKIHTHIKASIFPIGKESFGDMKICAIKKGKKSWF